MLLFSIRGDYSALLLYVLVDPLLSRIPERDDDIVYLHDIFNNTNYMYTMLQILFIILGLAV